MKTNGDLNYNFYPHTLEDIKIEALQGIQRNLHV